MPSHFEEFQENLSGNRCHTSLVIGPGAETGRRRAGGEHRPSVLAVEFQSDEAETHAESGLEGASPIPGQFSIHRSLGSLDT